MSLDLEIYLLIWFPIGSLIVLKVEGSVFWCYLLIDSTLINDLTIYKTNFHNQAHNGCIFPHRGGQRLRWSLRMASYGWCNGQDLCPAFYTTTQMIILNQYFLHSNLFPWIHPWLYLWNKMYIIMKKWRWLI